MRVNDVSFVEKDDVCRFDGCNHPALGMYSTPNGCACYPGDTTLVLCVQHAITAEPLGEMILVEVYDLHRYADLLLIT